MNRQQLIVLRDEVANDPLGRGYSTMTDLQIMDDLNTVYRTVRRALDLSLLETFLREQKIWRSLQQSTAASAKDFLSLFSGRIGSLDLDAQWVTDLGQELNLDGLLTAQQIAGMKALANVSISRAEELGLPKVYARDIEEARSIV